MADRDTIIEIEDLRKSYPLSGTKKLEVLRGINLKIFKEEICAITGKSGAGKSTLLHLLGTLDKPDSGKVLFEGENIFDKREKQLAEFRSGRIGFIFQFHHLLPEFTALENVMIATMIKGKENSQKALDILKEVGLEERAGHKPSELSGGEAQRVAIARALVNSPGLILADEPTGNLDSENADSIIRLIFDLRNKFKQTFVIVTHNEEFASRCDRIIKMTDGKILDQMTDRK
ncbi:MAG TPA: ABC transporter ATP-binding protein [Ignavibacteria bacterium]|nr:lipoprotein-releasing system ATP-binding protein LolD [Bacteroidota bacterium]HRI84097.1 ABC transporter ATP-binding protein [Ignavibacteria bacterium]HRJ99847.1 ABC transporter ATP-binding protein [Ignavibacteria bacterium]